MQGNCGECSRRWVCDIDPNECNEWPDPVPETNADRIRAMSDEELVKIFDLATNACPPDVEEGRTCRPEDDCKLCWLEWFRKPYKEGE